MGKIDRNRVITTILYFSMVILPSIGLIGQKNYYVSQTGEDTEQNGLSYEMPFGSVEYALQFLDPGDTLNMIEGIYFNDYFGDGDIWKLGKTISIVNTHGEEGKNIVIRPVPGEEVLLRGDGLYIFHIRSSSFIRVEGFEIMGEVAQIPLDSAIAYQFVYKDESGLIQYRVLPGTPPDEVANMTLPVLEYAKRPSYYDTKGLVIQKSHHIEISNCHIHHMPGTGLRTNGCDYVWFISNEVNDCSRRSPAGTHGLVVDSSVSIDDNDGTKFFITANEVHHNYNEIYSWSKNKSFIKPVIDEGKGISMQRNTAALGWTNGRMLISNNLTYQNGLSGIHVNTGERMDIINNTAHHNSFNGQGSNIGISLQSANDIRIINNISVAEPGHPGYALSMSNSNDVEVRNNLISGQVDNDIEGVDENTMIETPSFNGPLSYDFSLSEGSFAIGKALIEFAPIDDFFGNFRDENPDLGAIEFLDSSGIKDNISSYPMIYPNPTEGIVYVLTAKDVNKIIIFDTSGVRLKTLSADQKDVGSELCLFCFDTSSFDSGVYFIQLDNEVLKLLVQ